MTSPAVPPYSSTTIARWTFSDCISASRVATRLVSGTYFAGRMAVATGSLPRPERSVCTRSFVKATPTTSSTSSPWTGTREYPAVSPRSSARVTVAEAEIVTMSVRGTITSRTTVSPKEITEWMNARSVGSITSSWRATSAMASSSDSVTVGGGWPLPPISRSARPTSTDEIQRIGGNRVTASMTGAANRAARSVWRTA